MSRYDKKWCKMYRPVVKFCLRDPNLLAVYAYLCFAANFAESSPANGRSILKINPGEILITIKELSNELDLDPKTIKRCLKALKAFGAMDSKKVYKAMVVTINEFQESLTVLQDKGVPHSSSMNQPIIPYDKPIQHKEDAVYENQSFPMTFPMSGTHIKNKELRKEEGREEKAAFAANTPPFLKSIKEEKKEMGKLISMVPENSKTTPSEPSTELVDRWYSRVTEIAPIRRLTKMDISSQIEQLKNIGYSEEKLNQILGHLKTAKVGSKFIAPEDAVRDHFGRSCIEVAYAEFLKTEQGILSKKEEKLITPSNLNIREKIEREMQENIAKMKMGKI